MIFKGEPTTWASVTPRVNDMDFHPKFGKSNLKESMQAPILCFFCMVYWPITQSFIHYFIHQFNHSFVHSFIHSFIHSFKIVFPLYITVLNFIIQSFILFYIHLISYNFVGTSIHSFVHLFIHSQFYFTADYKSARA